MLLQTYFSRVGTMACFERVLLTPKMSKSAFHERTWSCLSAGNSQLSLRARAVEQYAHGSRESVVDVIAIVFVLGVESALDVPGSADL